MPQLTEALRFLRDNPQEIPVDDVIECTYAVDFELLNSIFNNINESGWQKTLGALMSLAANAGARREAENSLGKFVRGEE